MKNLIIFILFGTVVYFMYPLLILAGIGFVMSAFSGGTISSNLFSDELDPERDPAWDGRDLNTIFDDSLGDWDLDGEREEYF